MPSDNLQTDDPRLEGLTLQRRGPVLLIGLNRPEKRNALSPGLMHAITDAYEVFENDPALRVAVLFGHGKAFCAGADLLRLQEAAAQGQFDFSHTYDLFQMTGKRLTKPVVVAVHGMCLAGGMEVALAGDIIIAAHGTLLGQPEAARGLFAFGGGSVRWPERVGWGNAQRYLLTGDPIAAEEALRIGLVQEVVPVEDLLDHAIALAERIARSAPLGVRDSLRTGRMALEQGPQQAFDLTAELRDAILKTQDAAEGVASFLERRDGRFIGA